MNKVTQGIGVVCLMLGISGITGAMECGTGLVPSVILIAAGTIFMLLTSKSIRCPDEDELC